MGRGLPPCGIEGRAVGGLETPDTEEDGDGRRISPEVCSGGRSWTVSRVIGRGPAAAPVVALRASAGAGGTPKLEIS